MKKIILLSFILAGYFSSVAQLSDLRYFIRFTDKNNSPYSIGNPSAYLSARAIQRRANQNITIDNIDLPVNPQYIDSLLAHGATTFNKSKWFNGVTVSVPDSATLNAILSLPFVQNASHVWKKANGSGKNKFEAITPIQQSSLRLAQPVETQSYNYGLSYNQIHIMNGEYLHNLGFRGEGMVITLLDGGFYHADQLPVFDSLNADNRILGTWDFVADEASVYEDDGHGEAVLSCIASNMPDSLIGTAPEASFYLLRSEDVPRENIIEEYNWASAAEYADSVGTDVISSSLGYTTFDNFIFQGDTLPSENNHTYNDMNGNTCPSSIAADIAVSRGILVLTSAGNSGNDPWHYISAPSDGDSVLSIAAVGPDGFHADFSSYGPSSDGNVKPNVAAQGAYTVVQGTDGLISIYGFGTSFACPVLAGSATCLWQAHPTASAMEIHDAIQQSANYALAPNDSLGYGIPDFALAHSILSGIDENTSPSDALIVYPNPVNEDIRFLLNEKRKGIIGVELFDLTGKLICAAKLFSDGIHSNKLSGLHNLSKGIYMLKVTTGERVLMKRVMKMN
ncbi:MAG: S8 family peptidase [Bacteroidetes bacterium]|nr:S8 family peptidase [Bacteroidota bacterium]